MSIMGLSPVDRRIKSKFAACLGLRASLPIDAEAVANADRFRNAAGLNKLATDWPAARLVEIWNSLPGAVPVKKFKDRQTAVSRIWKVASEFGTGSLPAIFDLTLPGWCGLLCRNCQISRV
jgi:hypothetical protein